MRIAFLACLACATWLLLAPAPIGGLEEEVVAAPSRDAVNSVAHIAVFGLLTWLAFAARWPMSPWLLAGLLLAYAIGTECLQAVVPGRFAGFGDAALNVCGVALGAMAYWLWRQRNRASVDGRS